MKIFLESVRKITPTKVKHKLKKFRAAQSPTPLSLCLDYIHSLSLGPGDITMDIGANVGDITMVMAAKKATVFAFEPNPFAFDVLRQRFSEFPNVHCINKGIYDQNGVRPLFLHENSSEDPVYWSTGSSFLPFKGNINRDKYFEMEVVDIVKAIKEIRQNIKLMKMDVEGAEFRILDRLMESSAIDRVENIIVEAHDHKIPELKEEASRVRNKINDKGLLKIRMDWV